MRTAKFYWIIYVRFCSTNLVSSLHKSHNASFPKHLWFTGKVFNKDNFYVIERMKFLSAKRIFERKKQCPGSKEGGSNVSIEGKEFVANIAPEVSFAIHGICLKFTLHQFLKTKIFPIHFDNTWKRNILQNLFFKIVIQMECKYSCHWPPCAWPDWAQKSTSHFHLPKIPFLKRLVTVGERWILHNNQGRKQS